MPAWASIEMIFTVVSFLCLQCIYGNNTTVASRIEAQFPSEGYNYATGKLRGVIFNMTTGNETVELVDGIQVRLPLNIANIQPSTKLEAETEIISFSSVVNLSASVSADRRTAWSASLEYAGILETMAKSRGLKAGKYTPLGVVGFSVGRSQDSEYRWARQELESVQSSIISAKASFDFVQVFMQRPWKLFLSQDFLLDFSLLPTRAKEWLSAFDQDKIQYKLFFDAYGTHYVDTAKFGGSYQSVIASRSCDIVLKGSTSAALETCARARLSFSLSELFPFLPELSNEQETCKSFTSDGTARGEWTFSQVKTKQTWEGGSLNEAPEILTGDFSSWIADIKSNPRSVPTSITSVPDMIRTIHSAFELDECIPCKQLQKLGLSADSVATRLNNLDTAFSEYLYEILEDKMRQEDTCGLACTGPCDGRAGPSVVVSDQCTCPEPDAETCQEIETDEILQVELSRINFRVHRTGPRGAGVGWRKRIRMYVSGLGALYDVGPIQMETRDSVEIQGSFKRLKGESVLIEVVVFSDKRDNCGGLLKPEPCDAYCVGSIEYDFAKIGKAISLTGPCIHGNRDGDKVLQDAEVSLEGRVSYPHCCDCVVVESDGDDLGGLSNVALAFAILAPILCCCCIVCLGLAGGQ